MAWYMRKERTHVTARGKNRCGIFLDVDGVMHPFPENHREIEDPFCHMALLLQILQATDCDVVLSSSWRMDAQGIQEVNDRLRDATQRGEEAEVLDVTVLQAREKLNAIGNRDIEILAWVAAHAEEVGWGNRWITLDDLNLAPACGEEHAVVTDYEVGLTPQKVTEAIRKLRALVDASEVKDESFSSCK